MTDITLLDGGMGQELVHRAGDAPTPLWSTQIMRDHPGLVAQVHADYRAAGATVHTANTYAIHRDRLAGTPLEGQFETLHTMALKEVAGPGRIAGAIGPLGASYRPDLHPAHDLAVAKYAEVALILSPSVDLIIAETVASVAHARAVLEAALTVGKPVWLAMTVDDRDGTKLRSGEPVADVLTQIDGADAILANCSAPEAIGAAMAVLASGPLPFGGYANGFQQITSDFLKDKPTVDALSPRRDLGPEAYAAYAMDWIAQGATIVGGCCEVGPGHIATLAEAIRAAGHTIV
ncbi:homocysteine S-methyltransferase family protein [Yoonia sediminilitoris]|uniref:Homocysteine S-methyltransferase n=1 Tax=Yoonia sediminilitoris TaxID=1286148 RepID=A0A2T6KPI1_9RHOB|nr:homocysteine S-methyltransferase family protein [Yoonia sediminilitoris]PUB18473.1 homocysteine S-methyltransferase [Yoonia sediminilitoris]RCW98641.1 homocysteine S-methyltransferase [Yoonia sediminilitoris]